MIDHYLGNALIFNGPWDLSLQKRSIPTIDLPTDVLVRVRATGICGTDIGIVRGIYAARRGVVLGHEAAGEVIGVGSRVQSVGVGDRVVVDPTYSCGCCTMCRSERPNHCAQKSASEAGVSCDGAFATYYVASERFIHKIAADLSYAEASFTEPLSCVLTGLNQLRLRADLEVMVLGGGPMGMLYALALASRGIRGTLVECAQVRYQLCVACAPSGWKIMVEAKPVPGSLDLIVDTTGCALPWALDALKRGGQMLLVSLSPAQAGINPAMLTDRSLSLVGSIDSIGTFALALHMIECGTVPVLSLVTHQLPLAQYREGFHAVGVDLARQKRMSADICALKVVLCS
jgi:threonine dehydrogenase-like Zn-dependent dehydrogenase